MIGLLQRVASARVEVAGETVGAIGEGLLVLIGVERGDDRDCADRLLEKLLAYRVFPDGEGKMNLSLREVAGGLLLVPQFTLPADTRKGLRPSFTPAAPPAEGQELFDYLVQSARQDYGNTQCGRFGADMDVSLINRGPVTFWLRVEPKVRGRG